MKKWFIAFLLVTCLSFPLLADELPMLGFQGGKFVYQGYTFDTFEFYGPQCSFTIAARDVTGLTVTEVTEGKIITIKTKDDSFIQLCTWKISVIWNRKGRILSFHLG